MSVISIKSATWFDRLPAEIIFMIFNYLSSNDIIDIFFHLSQRLKNILLQNPHYFNYLELPTTDLNIWERILSIIGSQIQCLKINTLYLSIPLTYFSNLKSLIISSPYGLSNKEMKLILKSNQFKCLHSFKVKQSQLCSEESSNDFSTNEDYILNKIFSTEHMLETFQYSWILPDFTKLNTNSFITNFNLHSLTLILYKFEDIFSIIEYTPNLKYLNLHSNTPYEVPIKKSDIKLKELYLKLDFPIPCCAWILEGYYAKLVNNINNFSSSLICLSLDLVGLNIRSTDEFPFNNIKLQKLLEPMNQLKQFHLYAKLDQGLVDRDKILLNFKDQFWFDHNYSFGMHGNYFYTLPFNFDYLYQFYQGFNDVKSNYDDILISNPRLWYNVKSIDLPSITKHDLNFVKELKIKMPKLTFINFDPSYQYDMNKTKDINLEKMRITLDTVTTFKCMAESLEKGKIWLINTLPNLTHLILLSAELPSIDNQLTKVLNKRIQRLDIDAYCGPKQLTDTDMIYFSNVQNINFCLNDFWERPEEYANFIVKMMKSFQTLQTLLIYTNNVQRYRTNHDVEKLFSRITDHLHLNNILKNYEMKTFRGCLLFLKR
jgi:hypothetical protein